MLLIRRLQLGNLLRRQRDVHRIQQLIQLFFPRRADNRCGNPAFAQQPCQRHLGAGCTGIVGNACQTLGNQRIAGFCTAIEIFPHFIRYQASRGFAPWTGQSTARQRAPRDHRHALLMAQRQHLALFFTIDQVVVILHGDKACPAVLCLEIQRLGKLRRVHRRRADVARFTGFHHVVQRFKGLFNGGVVIPAVDLQQVDVIHVQAAKAVINGTQDLRARKAFGQIARLVINLGSDDDLIPPGKVAQSAANDLLAAAVGVAVGGVKEVNAAFNGAFDNRTTALFRQRPGVVSPIRLAKGHAAQAKSGNLQVRFS